MRADRFSPSGDVSSLLEADKHPEAVVAQAGFQRQTDIRSLKMRTYRTPFSLRALAYSLVLLEKKVDAEIACGGRAVRVGRVQPIARPPILLHDGLRLDLEF